MKNFTTSHQAATARKGWRNIALAAITLVASAVPVAAAAQAPEIDGTPLAEMAKFDHMQPTVLQAPYQAPGAPKDHAFYSQFTYNWTDGAGQSHTNAITDVATNPYQIVAMLKEIYTNRNIPGTKSLPDNLSSGTTVEVNYNYYSYTPILFTRYSDRSWKDWTTGSLRNSGSYSNDVDNDLTPYEDGLTLLLVEVKDDFVRPSSSYSSLWAHVNAAFKSVRLITQAARIDDASNPRTIVTVQGDLNRFFFMAKGKVRQADDLNDMLFEEFSPTVGDSGEGTDYVPKDFYDKLMAGESYAVQHDCEDVAGVEHYFAMAGKTGTQARHMDICLSIPDRRLTQWSGRTGGTKTYFYYNPDYSPSVLMYTIALTAQAQPMASDPDHYYTATLNWTNSFSGSVSSLAEQYEVYTVGEDGEPDQLVATTTDGTQTYACDIERLANKSQTLTWVVKATTNTGMVVWSNHASVYVPGNPPEAAFAVSATLNSTYSPAQEQNQYNATVLLVNQEGTMFDYRFVGGDNKMFMLERTDDANVVTPVASMELTPTDATATTYNYVISYLADDRQGEQVAGTLTHSTSTLELGEGVPFTDVFAASTAAGDQSGSYSYQMRLVSTEVDMQSNTATVQVLKTTPVVNAATTYTLEQVAADSGNEPTLQAATADVVEFAVTNNSDILYYNVMRDGTLAGYAHRNADGTFTAFGLTEDGTYANCGESNDGSIAVSVARTPDAEDHNWWVEIVRRNADGEEHSTFGTVQDLREMALLSIEELKTSTSMPYRSVTKDVLLAMSPSAYSATHVGSRGYRLWRKVGNDDWTLVDLDKAWNTLPGQAGSVNGWDWIQVNDLEDGLSRYNFQHNDAFASPESGDGLTIQYVMHAYISNVSEYSAPSLRAPEATVRYTVAQGTLSSTFTSDEVTGLTQVELSQLDGNVSIYGIDGRRAYSGPASGAQLQPGTWVVVTASNVFKLIAK